MAGSIKKLPRRFYNRAADIVAEELLGMILVLKKDGLRRVGRIVETEAYLGPHDLAAHSARGRTPRTEVMFGAAGYAYVYMIYGMYFCMNVVTEPKESASAVLIRGVEPLKNIEGRADGPGRLCRAMGIDKSLNGHDLLSSDFHIADDCYGHDHTVVRRPRIGVDYAGEWAKKPLRFYIAGNAHVSKK